MIHLDSPISRAFGFSMVLLGASACGVPYRELSAPQLPPSVTTAGDTIYFGSVFPLEGDASDPTYVYERRVDERDGAMVSTHITREPSGAIARAETAIHDADYALAEYTLHADQLGQKGTIRVDGERVWFHLSDGQREADEMEAQTLPVVVGPTLVGFITHHLDELAAGQSVAVRLAVLDRLETIGFDLEAVAAEAGQTRIEMTPSSFVIALAIDPVTFTFDSSGKLVRLEGRVPPRVRDGSSWADFDARVEYDYVAAAYR